MREKREKVEKKEGIENRGRSGKKIMRRKGVRPMRSKRRGNTKKNIKRENKRTEGRTRENTKYQMK